MMPYRAVPVPYCLMRRDNPPKLGTDSLSSFDFGVELVGLLPLDDSCRMRLLGVVAFGEYAMLFSRCFGKEKKVFEALVFFTFLKKSCKMHLLYSEVHIDLCNFVQLNFTLNASFEDAISTHRDA